MMRKKSLLIKLTAVIVLLALATSSLCGCYNTTYYDKYVGNGSYSSMVFREPDYSRFTALCDELEANYDNLFSGFKAVNQFEEALDLIYDFTAMEALSEILSFLDVTDSELAEAHERIASNRVEAVDRLWCITETLKTASEGWVLRTLVSLDQVLEIFGGSYADNHNEFYVEYKKEEAALLKEYTDLTTVEYSVDGSKYHFLYEIPDGAKTFTENEDGSKSWLLTYYDVMTYLQQGYLSYETASEMIKEINRQKNADYGDVLIRLISIRKKIASSMGYASYKKYAYSEVFERKYDITAIGELKSGIKEILVSGYSAAAQSVDNVLLSEADIKAAEFYDDGLIDEGRKVLEAVSSDFKSIIDDMVSKKLINYQYSPLKMDVSFTTVVPCYEIPFIFLQPGQVRTFNDVDAFFHEFGHYYQFVSNTPSIYSQDLDSQEVMSQALELLCTSQYGMIYDKSDVCETLYNRAVSTCLYSIISSFIVDDFETKLFEEKNLTAERISEIYFELLVEYGLVPEGSDSAFHGGGWTDIYHIYSYPFYYISYGVSAISAISLFLSDNPVDTYKKFCANIGDLDISANCTACGLKDPLDKTAAIVNITKFLSTLYLNYPEG